MKPQLIFFLSLIFPYILKAGEHSCKSGYEAVTFKGNVTGWCTDTCPTQEDGVCKRAALGAKPEREIKTLCYDITTIKDVDKTKQSQKITSISCDVKITKCCAIGESKKSTPDPTDY